MSFRKARVKRLETHERRSHLPELAHFMSIASQPWDAPDREQWLAGLTCPCGVVNCHDLTIGAILPEKAPSADAWQARFQAYARRKAGHE